MTDYQPTALTPAQYAQLVDDLTRVRSVPAQPLTAAELQHLTHLAVRDALTCDCSERPERHPKHWGGTAAGVAAQRSLDDLAADLGAELAVNSERAAAANERWRRKRAFARGDDLAAMWPKVAGR